MSQQATTQANKPAGRPAPAAKAAALAANTVYSISFLLDRILANPTGFFTIVEKEPPKAAGRAPAAKPATASSVKYYKQQWDFGDGTKFIGNLKFNLVGNALTAEEIPETTHESAREDILAGKVRMYRGIGNPDDPTDHRNSYDKGDGKNNTDGLYKTSISSADAGKLGQFMILLDERWNAECERIKAASILLQKKTVNTLTSAFITEGENAGTMKDAPTFSVRIPVHQVYPAAFKSRAGQPKSIILDAATGYTRPNETTRRFLRAAIDTEDSQVIVDGTNAWEFVTGGSKFVAESEFEFQDPNCSAFGFAMALTATVPVIERREAWFAPTGSNLVGDENEYLASVNGEAPVPVVVPKPTTTTTTTQTATPAAPTLSADDDAAMTELMNSFK